MAHAVPGPYIDGGWHIDGRDDLGCVKRFRPWEDEE